MNKVIESQMQNLDKLRDIVDRKKELDEDVREAKELMQEMLGDEE